MAIIDQEVFGLKDFDEVGYDEAVIISQEYLQNNNIVDNMKAHHTQ